MIVQDQPRHLVVNLVPGPEYDDGVADQLKDTLHEIMGPGMQLELMTMKRIPQERNGKYRFTICRL